MLFSAQLLLSHAASRFLSWISSLRNPWDYRIHFAKPVQTFLAEHQNEVELVCLPTYSPKLNPVERECPHLRRQVTHNHCFQMMERLMEAVISFFRDMAASPDLVRSVSGLATDITPVSLVA